jgi:hypothetical protein
MRRLAIFVEGLTEELFAERLLSEVAKDIGLGIEKRRASGGKSTRRSFIRVTAQSDNSPDFYALIVNSGTDHRVKSDILENYASLVAQGYRMIVGMRDAYPEVKSFKDVPKLRASLAYKMPTSPCDVTFVLGVMEIEAWFIAEHTHFIRINRRLDLNRIRKATRFDPSKEDVQTRPCPTNDLKAIYKLGRALYTKDEISIRRTLEALDFKLLRDLRKKLPDLHLFIERVDTLIK